MLVLPLESANDMGVRTAQAGEPHCRALTG
eukprot:COSAG05_NODE_22907_length_261_cov_1.000000_1_plen_29_part_10